MSVNFYYYIAIVFAIAIISAVVTLVMMRKRAQKFLDEHPDAVKVTLKNVNWLLYIKTTSVHLVDGAKPVRVATSFTSQAFFLSPGTHILNVSFSKQRPGIIYKSVTTTYDPTNIEVVAEAGKAYRLYFNTSEKRYVFEEVEAK